MAVTEQSYTGNGSTTNYSFTFPYLKSTDIQVQVDQVVTTAWTFHNATTVKFNTAPANGAAIKILRDTNVDNLTATFYAGSAIKSEDLNDNYTQNLYVTQEIGNRSFQNTGTSTMIGHLQMGEDTTIKFEGATDNAHETTLTVVDPTADRTITLPNVTGTVVTTGDTGTVTSTMIADSTIATGDIANSAVTTAKINNDAITADKIADDVVNSEHYAAGSIDTEHIADSQVTTAKIAADAITGAKIADDAIDSEHYTNASIDHAHLANDCVDGDNIADDSINSEHYVDGSIDTAHLADSQITTAKIAGDAIITPHIQDQNVTTAKLADQNVTTAKLADTQVTLAKVENVADGKIIVGNGSNRPTAVAVSGDVTLANTGAVTIASGAVETGMIAADAIDGTKIADNAIGSEHIAANAVTTSEIADAELTTLASMQSGTASILAGSTALAATLTEINTVCDGKSVETTISNTDAAYPTSGAVVDYVAAQIAPVGGLEVIADDESFPETQPVAGVVISIADAGGLVVNGSGTSTTGDTITSNGTVTINNINSQFHSTTIAAGVGMQVSSTGSGHIYNYHKALLKEADLANLSTDINDFGNRYRVNAGEPSSNNDEGDLVYDTNADKMKVYDSTTSAWKEVTSTGDFKYLFLCPAGGSGSPTLDGSIATYDLREGSNSGSAASVSSAAQLIVSINGVVQKANTGTSAPAEGFALVDANTIIFGANLASGDSVFIVQIGSAVSIPTPGDNTVSTAKLQNASVNTDKLAADAVTGAKIADDAVTAAKLATMDDHVEWADNKYAKFGDSGDLCVYHNVNSFIKDNGAGSLILDTNGLGVKFTKSGLSETMAYFITDGACELYYDNVKKIETESDGVAISGTLSLGDGDGTGGSNKISFGASDDLNIFHNGSNSYIDDTGTGDLFIRGSNDLYITNTDGSETKARFATDGAVYLYYDNTSEFETKSGGVKLNGHSEQIVTALTSASTVTIDFSLSNHFSCTMGHNITFANPSTESVGQSGTITLTQDGTGSRTAAWGTQFLWAGGTAPTLTTTANAIDRIDYVVVAADKIHCVATLALD